jgi:hypothetical protein
VPSSTYCMASSPQVNQRDGPYEFRTVRLSTAHHERLGHSVARYPQHVRKLLLHAHGRAVLTLPTALYASIGPLCSEYPGTEVGTANCGATRSKRDRTRGKASNAAMRLDISCG